MTGEPRPPTRLGKVGRRLWRDVTDGYELEEHEAALLAAMARTADRIEALEAVIAAEGLTVTGHGSVKIHPAVVEARQQAVAFARIAAALRLPAGEDGEGERRPQRRSGVRGVYSIRGGAA